MDRALDYGSKGQGFKSFRAHFIGKTWFTNKAKANIKYIDLYIRLKQELNIQLSGIAESNKPSAITKQNPDNDLLLTNKGIFYTGDHTITEEDVLNLFPEINK